MLQFIEGDINHLELPDETFDIVYCRHVLEHQPYYERPIREMLRVSRDLVVMNVFRWSLHEDAIRRVKYYSNSYEIGKFLTFVAGLGAGFEYCLVLKGEQMGKNAYEDKNIRRTGDHLVVIIKKRGVLTPDQLYWPLDKIGAVYQRRPYDEIFVT